MPLFDRNADEDGRLLPCSLLFLCLATDSMPSASLLAKPGFAASLALGTGFKGTCLSLAQRLWEMREQSGIIAFFHMPSVKNKLCHGLTWQLIWKLPNPVQRWASPALFPLHEQGYS